MVASAHSRESYLEDAMIDVLVIRHGQSVWNAQGRWQGQADPPLTELGLSQAAAAADYLADLPDFDGVASSTLDRAATTADTIAARLGFDAVHRIANLSERSAGEWSGLTRHQIEKAYPGFLKQRRYPPGYERDPEFLVRIHRGLSELLALELGERIAVVAHGGLLYCLEATFGLAFQHMANLGARQFRIGPSEDPDRVTIELGDRIELLTGFSGEKTTPGAI